MRRLLFVGLAAAFSLAACRRSPAPSRASQSAASQASSDGAAAFPMRSVDDAGHSVEIQREPRRIVALLPSFTETLFALGVGQRIVGVDDFSDYPPEVASLPKLGGSYDAHVEQIVALSPDLVLCATDFAATAALDRNGVPIWQGDALSFDDVFREIEAVGALVGRIEKARQLAAHIRADIATLEGRTRSAPRISVYYELDPTPYSVGPGSFIGVLLEKAGGQNIVPKNLGDFPKLSPEFIVAANPAVILGAHPHDIAVRPGFARLSAVEHGRVYEWSPDEEHLVSRPGPRLADALRALIHKLHPELG